MYTSRLDATDDLSHQSSLWALLVRIQSDLLKGDTEPFTASLALVMNENESIANLRPFLPRQVWRHRAWRGIK